MKLCGLFVGIDRFGSSGINWLSCARRDAVALHALFTDTLGGNTVLLVDEQATRSAIEKQFERLVNCDEDDVVVIAFSGHGTETHELVTYDTDRRNLTASSIPLDTLTKWFSLIPARHVICILDCCFSGGMGAKALQVDIVPRDVPSADDLLDQLSGEGRVILTASRATEKAWENAKVGHGLLTHNLLQALQGLEEVREGGRISIYRLLEHVSREVIDQAAKIGKQQHPTLRGSIDGNLQWPILRPGSLYQAAFPERIRKEVTPEIQSLSSYGFPQALLDAWAGSIPSLNQLQIDAINQFDVLNGAHLVVSAPTSSGKTMVGELATLRGILNRKRAFFLLPLKALVNDKLRYFNQVYGPFGIRTIRATGETSSDNILPLMRGQYDICLLTYEKFAALILGNPYLLDQVGTIVVDEVQMIADESRGINLEFVLTLLKMRRRQGSDPQLIALSAVIGDTNGLERWLEARLLRREERPVPLDEGVIRADGTFRFISSETGKEEVIDSYVRPEYRKGSSQDIVVPLVRKLVSEGEQVIVFRETRGYATGCAGYLSQSLGLPAAQVVLDTLPNGDPSTATEKLRAALTGGVAFHISDLDPDERVLVEEQFRATPTALRVIAATTTLAMGINTPAEAVIVVGLKHPGNKPYSVAEYKNMVGRAGRLGLSEKGTSYIVAMDPREEYEVWNHYVMGQPENLNSRFLADQTDPRSLIVRVLAAAQYTGKGMPADEIVTFLEESFGAFQEKQAQTHWKWNREQLLESLNTLRIHNLVNLDNNVYHLTELGRLTGEAGVEVQSILRLVEALSQTDPSSINDPALIAATQLTVELDKVLFPINKKSNQKEPQTWVSEIRRQAVPPSIIRALSQSAQEELQSTLRAKKAVACLLWITDRPLAEMENILTQFGGRLDGAAGPIRSLRARTCDLLPVVSRVAELIHPGLELGERTNRLLVRLEIGIPAKIVGLGKLLGDKLSRGDYLKLVQANLCDMESQ
jgi:helicase